MLPLSTDWCFKNGSLNDGDFSSPTMKFRSASGDRAVPSNIRLRSRGLKSTRLSATPTGKTDSMSVRSRVHENFLASMRADMAERSRASCSRSIRTGRTCSSVCAISFTFTSMTAMPAR